MNTLAAALTDRIAIEREENTLNDNKSKTFERLMKSSTDVIAKTFDKYSVDMSFVASRRRKTAMLNVYAVDRTIDLAAFMSGNVALNHFTMHIVKSLANLNKNNIDVLTYNAARACCSSLGHATDKKIDKMLSKVSKPIADSTVNTQCTITLDALRIMNVIEVTSTSSGEKAYKFTSNEARDAVIAQMTKHNML